MSQKITGWAQGLNELSTTKKETLGALRVTEDGRSFRYAKSAGALIAGKLASMVDGVAEHVQETGDVVAKGAIRVSLVVAAAAVTANQYADGYLQVYDGTAGTVGHQYAIKSNTACDASGTTIVTLKEPIRVALVVGDTWSLILNPWSGVTHIAAIAHGVAGVVPITVGASGYYFWIQTGGVACVLAEGAIALGAGICQGATSGSVKVQPDGKLASCSIGNSISQAATSAKYNPVWLTLD